MEGADESTESCQPHSGTILRCEAAAESVSQPNLGTSGQSLPLLLCGGTLQLRSNSNLNFN